MARRGDGLQRRGRVWWLDFTHEGQRCVVKIGRGISRSVAADIAAVKRVEILKAGVGVGKKSKDISFDMAAELFLEWARLNRKPRTWQCYNSCVIRLREFFGSKTLRKISQFDCERYKQKRAADGARVGANRELACLREMFNKCLAWKKVEGENPVKGVRKFEESPGRIRFLSAEEETRLLEACTEPLRTVVLTGIHAGVRVKSEGLTLKWEHIDLARRQLTVESCYAKNHETRVVPINSILWEALCRLKEHSTGEFVFINCHGDPLRDIKTPFATACRRAKIADVSPHVLRHTFASRLAMAGVDIRTIQDLGGWKKIEMVMRYSHLSPGHKAEAVEKIVQNSTTLITTIPKVVSISR
jgi:integrase